ncbi:hypothetical protein [Streptomyces sp. NPDC056883]|uniref:hypothetical protein n=1 Tax=Streptomyces sp. NPDC056883 TaxID=3345959 RepID=UPI0036CAC041
METPDHFAFASATFTADDGPHRFLPFTGHGIVYFLPEDKQEKFVLLLPHDSPVTRELTGPSRWDANLYAPGGPTRRGDLEVWLHRMAWQHATTTPGQFTTLHGYGAGRSLHSLFTLPMPFAEAPAPHWATGLSYAPEHTAADPRPASYDTSAGGASQDTLRGPKVRPR